ncbi:serine hydrolase [Ruoffia tabacinasalis]|uniref:Serine hydrolase n=1 Tax=Ruoffia tabacinasalis TaxID=87458 RepID=A0A5R9DYH2_9LACT|nr:serine hydrolase [Ruoffia tabacinasalis]TLQ41799.1 serine hydrolase [Ruoffia tabacinasalis]
MLKKILLFVSVFLLAACSTSEESVPVMEEEKTTQSESVESETEESVTEELSKDYSQFTSIEELLTATIQEFGLNPEAVSVAYYNYQTDTDFFYNERSPMLVGSVTKVGVARLYADLIADGVMSFETELPYSDALFEEGAGPVTNGEKKASYPLYELFYNSLALSDNTAFNMLFSYYQQIYGNVQESLLNLSGLSFDQAEYTTNNMADAQMILNILLPVATEDKYSYILTSLSGNTEAEYFKKYVQEGMFTKYGSIGGSLHDSGIYMEDGEPVYALVVLTNGQGNVDEFLATMNLRMNEWGKFQQQNTQTD